MHNPYIDPCRRAPQERLPQQQEKLIKTMYEENGNSKLSVVVDDFGGPVSLFFLTRVVDQAQKDK